MESISVILILAAIGCLAANFAYSLRFARNRQENRTRTGFVFSLLALVFLVAEFMLVSMVARNVPLTSMGDSMIFFAAVLVAVSTSAARVSGSQVIWLLVSPITIALCALSLGADRWLSTTAAQQTVNSTFLIIHVLFFVLSYALFSIGAAFGALFLLQDSVLKTKNYTPLFFKLPGLTKLEKYSVRSVMVGFILLTLALSLAFVSLQGAGPLATFGSKRHLITDATVIASIILWVYYAIFALLRLTLGWTGRRVCYLSLIGLFVVFGTYIFGKVIPNRGLHGFETPTTMVVK